MKVIRLRDLPEAEREPFMKWLRGETAPIIEGVPDSEQDAVFEHDYLRWKAGLSPAD